VIRARTGRWGTSIAITALLASLMFVGTAQAGKSTSKVVLIGSSTSTASGVNDPGPNGTVPANLTFTPVSAGNMTFFDVVVKNAGGQTLNNVQLAVGFDNNGENESARPVTTTSVTPTFPVAFPTATATVSSFVGSGAGCSAGVAPTDPAISCAVGTLNSGKSFTLQVVLVTSRAAPTSIPLKAVTKVAENTNDSGSNQDTFAAEGGLPVIPFSCDGSTAFLPTTTDPTKSLSTCAIGDAGNDNNQSFGVTFPAHLTTLALKEDDAANLCPPGVVGCFGSTFSATINGSATSDIVLWTLNVDLVAVNNTNLNLNKLVVYHFDDNNILLAPTTGIANTKQNQCKSDGQANCIKSAAIDATTNVLTVKFQTAGNGSTRLR